MKRPVSFARACYLCAMLDSDPHLTTTYTRRIVPFEQMVMEAPKGRGMSAT